MNNTEILYEISLKYNTLKMYENTIEQMRKNGADNGKNFEKVLSEKNIVEKELNTLLNPKTEINENRGTRVFGKEKGNEFLKEALKDNKYKDTYKTSCSNFFDKINKYNEPVLEKVRKEEPKEQKTRLCDIQEKISNAQWVLKQNFILKFPKETVNIDPWRVSSFDYELNRKMCRGNSDITNGNINIVVNDFVEIDENGDSLILTKVVQNLYKKSYDYKIGDISAEIINNVGETLYTIIFKDCKFKNADFGGFDYMHSNLRTILLSFCFEDMKIISPNETNNQ